MYEFADGDLKNKNNKINFSNMKDYMYNKDIKLSVEFEDKINKKIKEMQVIIEDKIKATKTEIEKEENLNNVVKLIE